MRKSTGLKTDSCGTPEETPLAVYDWPGNLQSSVRGVYPILQSLSALSSKEHGAPDQMPW